jgi:hypothetical protein
MGLEVNSLRGKWGGPLVILSLVSVLERGFGLGLGAELNSVREAGDRRICFGDWRLATERCGLSALHPGHKSRVEGGHERADGLMWRM